MKTIKKLLLFLIICISCQFNQIALASDKIIINIPSRTLELFKGGKLIKTYPVGVGRSSFPTPIGQFQIITMVEDPGWENPYKPLGHIRIHSGKTNPLGTRWIGFKADKGGEFGIHGTDNPASVGKYSSHGCVRMKVKDAEDLFKHVRMNMPVLVTYDTARVQVKNSDLYLKTYPDEYKRGQTSISDIKSKISKMEALILWNASTALNILNNKTAASTKIGTIIDEVEF